MDRQKNLVNTADYEFTCNIGDAEFSVLLIFYPIEAEIESSKLPHTHTYFELLHIFSGCSVYEDENVRVELRDGDTVIEAPGHEHNNIGSENCKACKIGFSFTGRGRRKNSIYRMFYEAFNLLNCEIVKSSEDIGRLCMNIEKSAHSSGNPYRISASFTDLMFYLYDYCVRKYLNIKDKNNSDKSGHSPEDLINNALLYYYKSDISTVEMAEKTHLSQRQINRICHRMYGRTFNEQKTLFRIKNAEKLLRETENGILQICMECGFGSMGSFYSAFTKAVGTTPSKYRKSPR